jgi:signal transduction histidine kinase
MAHDLQNPSTMRGSSPTPAAQNKQIAPSPASPDVTPQTAPAAPNGSRRPRRLAAWQWVQRNTFVPTWLPMRLHHPAAGYLLAALVQIAVAVINRLLNQYVPTYHYHGVLEVLAVALIAMNWGAGPGVFAALVALVLDETSVLPTLHGEGQLTGGDFIEGVLFLAIGICLSLVASTTERSRRRAVEEKAATQVREAQAHEAALHQTQERMDEFVAVASHDLRSPLMAALGFNEVAAQRYQRLTSAIVDTRPDLAGQVEAVRTTLTDASQSVERVGRLVDVLFDTTQVRAGKLELHCTPCDLVALVREQVLTLRVAHPHRTVHLELPPEGPVPVVADADRIGQVVTNYVTNALKYSQGDQPVAIQVARDGAWARVSVEDHGPGLPAPEQERIWERFYQAEGLRVHSGSRAGLGLGLHICKTIVEGHEGAVGIKSAVGAGSTFWFTLPLAEDASART